MSEPLALSGRVRSLARAVLVSGILFLSWAVSSQAAIIGSNDWLPLSEAADKFGLSTATVNMLLDTGGELTCTRKNEAGQTVSYNRWVGWIASLDPPTILTVGHSLFDKSGAPVTEARLAACYFASNRAVLDGDDYARAFVNPDFGAHLFGGDKPSGPNEADYFNDRMMLLLRDPIGGGVPLTMLPVSESSVHIGDELFAVSAGRPFNKGTLRGGIEPMIVRCAVLGVKTKDDTRANGPRLLFHDCDPFNGVSGGILFRRSATDSGALVPLALTARMDQPQMNDGTPIDGKRPRVGSNDGIALVLDEWFFDFATKLDRQAHDE